MLREPLILEHVHQGCLAGIIQTQEQNLCILVRCVGQAKRLQSTDQAYVTAHSKLPSAPSTSLSGEPHTSARSPSPSEFSTLWNLHAAQGWAQRRCEGSAPAEAIGCALAPKLGCAATSGRAVGRLPLPTNGVPWAASGPPSRPAGAHQFQIHIVPPLPQILGPSRSQSVPAPSRDRWLSQGLCHRP